MGPKPDNGAYVKFAAVSDQSSDSRRGQMRPDGEFD
jgi:hypothetical protein